MALRGGNFRTTLKPRDGLVARASQEFIGSYRLLNLIMTGQTSQVWEVIHGSRQERFALKMLLSDFAQDREHVGYLKHEYEVGRGLEHPRVVKIFDMGTHQRTPFIIMEYFPYPNLKQYIRRGIDYYAHLVPQIVEQAAEGLAYFNAQGWIHRDIKPDNYLIDDKARIKLIDFALAQKPKTGLAKLFGGRAKKIQGTRSYMSPEQIRGQALDLRADVYSFACMVYELLSGKPPFTGVNANELLMKHLKNPPPALAAANSNVTIEFSELLQRMMAKKPENRPDSMEKFLTELKNLRIYRHPPAPPTDGGAG